MSANILIVDSDEAFATILKEGLETNQLYKAKIATSGEEALEAIVEQPFDMTIVDMGLPDIEGSTLVKAIREAKPTMRIMLIPLFGEELSPEAQSLDIQGILTKPFFMGDLPRKIEEALARPVRVGLTAPVSAAPVARPKRRPVEEMELPPTWLPTTEELAMEAIREAPPPPALEGVEEEGPAPAPPPPTEEERQIPLGEILRKIGTEINKHLTNLAFDLSAESVLLTHASELVAHAGNLNKERSQKLAVLVADSFAAVARAAKFLGETNGHFELSQNEGEDYSLYSRSVTEDLVLSVALRADTPPGTVRYITKQTADRLAKLVRGAGK